jgi:hypothetical protein
MNGFNIWKLSKISSLQATFIVVNDVYHSIGSFLCFQVLASLRQKFDQATAGIANVHDVVKEARRYLRDVAPRTPAVLQVNSEEVPRPLPTSSSSHAVSDLSSLAHKGTAVLSK